MINLREILDSYYKPEEVERVEALERELPALDNKYREKYGEKFTAFDTSFRHKGDVLGIDIKAEGWENDYLEERGRLFSERRKIHDTVINRYKEEKKPEGILEDIRRISNSYEQEDFLHHINVLRETLINIELKSLKDNKEEDLKERSYYTYLQKYSEESYYSCFSWIYGDNPEIEELLSGEDLVEAIEIIKERVDSFGYERPEEGILSRDLRKSPELPEIQKLDFNYPTNLKQNLTKASRRIFDSSIALSDLKQREIDVSKKGSLRTYAITVDLTAPELKGTENITEYDKSVHNMAVSIGAVNKHGFFTARELATALIHGNNPNNNRVSAQQIGAVTKSIEKQRHIDISINWTEHIRLNNNNKLPDGTEVKDFEITDYMLPLREYTATIGGKTLKGYQFIDPVKLSPLYQYALSVGQIGQHPLKMLNIPINLDQQKLIIRDFLLEEIAHLKNHTKDWNCIITVDRLLTVAGEDPQTITRKKKSSLLKASENMLLYWKEEKYIRDYEITKAKTTGSPIYSFTIKA